MDNKTRVVSSAQSGGACVPVAVLLMLVTLVGCQTLPGERIGSRPADQSPAPVISGTDRGGQASVSDSSRAAHIVRPNETLFSIGRQYGVDWRLLAAWNEIPSSHLILPGQSLWVQAPGEARMTTAQPPPAATPAPPAVAQPAPQPAPQPSVAAPEPQAAAQRAPALAVDGRPAGSLPRLSASPDVGRSTWVWPAPGALLRGFAAGSDGKQGIQIGGEASGPVWAVANGVVVYSGSDLVGYGNLVILRHDGNFFSAYGYNDALLVTDGETVRQGQPIARMGSRGGRPLLHFELRRDGRAIDPLAHLPRR
jgi:lipoprotein NlpD